MAWRDRLRRRAATAVPEAADAAPTAAPEAARGTAAVRDGAVPGDWDGGWRMTAPPALTVSRAAIGVSDGLAFRAAWPRGATRRSTPGSPTPCCRPPRRASCAGSPAPPVPAAAPGAAARCCCGHCGSRTRRRRPLRRARRRRPAPRRSRAGSGPAPRRPVRAARPRAARRQPPRPGRHPFHRPRRRVHALRPRTRHTRPLRTAGRGHRVPRRSRLHVRRHAVPSVPSGQPGRPRPGRRSGGVRTGRARAELRVAVARRRSGGCRRPWRCGHAPRSRPRHAGSRRTAGRGRGQRRRSGPCRARPCADACAVPAGPPDRGGPRRLGEPGSVRRECHPVPVRSARPAGRGGPAAPPSPLPWSARAPSAAR